MSFFDDPNIDSSSKVSEESVLATKSAFLQKKGFLVREENPDKGVDLDVELIVENQVSAFKFAIQIKSCKELSHKKKKGKLYVAYSIKTSRLGYLCRRMPGLGLVVLYDDNTKVTYYDYVEELYKRIMEMNGNEEWMSKDSVTFHIPVANVLDDVNTQQIYDTMQRRSCNFSEMYSKMASDFGLPTFDHDELREPSALLKKYGYVLFNKKDYNVIYAAISKLSLCKLTQNPKLLLLAAITYYQIGKCVEGDFFLAKCQKYLASFDDEEVELLNLTKLASDFTLGRVEREAYRQSLVELAPSIRGEHNCIYISLQILFHDLLCGEMFDQDKLSETLAAVNAVGLKIVSLDVEEDIKYSYMLELAAFLHHIGMRHFIKFVSQKMLVSKMLGKEIPFAQRLDSARLIAMLTSMPQEFLKYVWDYSIKNGKEYLRGVVLYKKAYMFHSFLFHQTAASYESFNSAVDYKADFPTDLVKTTYYELLECYNIFYGKGDLYHAYRALSLSVEVNFLYSLVNSVNINDAQCVKVASILRALGDELGIDEPRTVTESMMTNLLARKEEDPYAMYTSLEEDEIEKMCSWVVRSTGLPPERVVNMVSEIEFMKKALQAIDVKYFDVFQNLAHTKSVETMYEESPRYVISCKKCEYETVESNDLDVLLACLRSEHGFVCL